MKVLILAPFAAEIISSIIWYEGAERNCLTITRTRKGRRRKCQPISVERARGNSVPEAKSIESIGAKSMVGKSTAAEPESTGSQSGRAQQTRADQSPSAKVRPA
jgi:hypothetical protein